jgi:hypothetical protein
MGKPFGYSVLAAALLATQSANAIVITAYSDRASWEAAAGDFTVENFDSTPDTLFSNNFGLTIALPDFTVTVDPTDHGFLSRGIIGGGLNSDVHASNAPSPIPRFMRLGFLQSIDAFAMDLAGVGNDCMPFGCTGGVMVVTFAGPDASIGFHLSAGTSFFGLVSQGLVFDSLTFTKLPIPGTDNRDSFRIDNVAYRVDEPRGLVLLGLSILLLISQRRFRAA